MTNKTVPYFLLFILFLPSLICAQAKWTPQNRVYSTDIYFENSLKESNKKNQLQKKTILSNKTFRTKEQFVQYDKEGRVIGYKTTRGQEIKIKYFSGNLKHELAVYKNNKLVERDSFLWNKDGLISSCFYFNNKNQLIGQESYRYDSIFVVEYIDSKVKKNKYIEKRKRITEYYPDFSIKKITYYKNGKPDYYSVFDCNPIGEERKIKKDSAYNCVKYDVDSLGNKIKVTIINTKRFPIKEVEYFNEKNELVAKKTYSLKKDQLEWAYYYKPGAPTFTKFISYKNKKEYYRIEQIFDEKNIQNCLESTTYNRSRLKRKYKNTYNQKDLLVSRSKYNRRDKKTTEYIYSYEHY